MKKTILLSVTLLIVALTGCEFGMKKLTDELLTPPGASVIYDANGADRGSAPVDGNEYRSGSAVTVLDNTGNLEKDNSFYFTGWNTLADGSGTNYTPVQTFTIGKNNVTLYARWQQGTFYKVTYSANGGTGEAPVSNTWYESGTAVYVKNSGTLYFSGYTFGGWNTNPGGTGTNYTTGDSFTITADTTLYAKWEGGETYTVTYYPDFPANATGNTGGSVPVDDTHYVPGAEVNVLNNTGNLYCQGFNFGGWTYGSATYSIFPAVVTMGNSNISFNAKWNTFSYVVSFNSQGADTAASPAAINVISPDWNVGTLPSDPVKTNYNFGGWWFTPQNGSPIQLLADTEVPGSISVYPLWNGTITFDKNAADAVGNMSPQTISYGETASLNPCGFSRPGCTFYGWNTESGGSGTAYSDLSSYTMNTGSVTLYARWIFNYVESGFNTAVNPGDNAVVAANTVAANMKYASNSNTAVTFPMGANDESTGTITRKFFMAETEVTNALFAQVLQWAVDNGKIVETSGAHNEVSAATVKYGTKELIDLDNNPTYMKITYNTAKNTFSVASGFGNHPVVYVSWFGAIMFCNWLTEMRDGNTNNVVYTNIPTDGTWNSSNAYSSNDDSKTGYRLPSSMEWEYAARYRNGTLWTYGDHVSGDDSGACYNDGSILGGLGMSTVFGNYAWFYNNSGVSTHVVGTASNGGGAACSGNTNALGLFDMSGNVLEWCFTIKGGTGRVVRGGCWYDDADGLRVGNEYIAEPYAVEYGLGFRFARTK